MQSLKLILFEMRKQITNLSFIIIVAILFIFAISQMKEIFHYPVMNNEDIIFLEKNNREYLYVEASAEELRTSTINYLNKIISGNEIKKDNIYKFKDLISKMQKENLNFDQAYEIALKENPDLVCWLDACKKQFTQKIGDINEVNENIKNAINKEGYNIIFAQKYVTYIQLISTFTILPLFLVLFIRDYKYNMNEIIFAKPISAIRYILCKYIGCLIPLLLILYIAGEIINLYLIHSFKVAGWQIDYWGFSNYYIIFIVPTILFLSSLIMFGITVFKRAIAIVPLYILYVIFNVTQGAFLGPYASNIIYKCVIRVTTENLDCKSIIINRSIYLILSFILIALSCFLYKNSRKNLRRNITI